MIFSEKASIVRAKRVKTPYGGFEYDWGKAEIIPLNIPVSIQPVTSSDIDGETQRVSISSRFRLYSKPPHILDSIMPSDRIRVEGWARDLDIVGDPGHWRTPLLPHTEVELEDRRG